VGEGGAGAQIRGLRGNTAARSWGGHKIVVRTVKGNCRCNSARDGQGPGGDLGTKTLGAGQGRRAGQDTQPEGEATSNTVEGHDVLEHVSKGTSAANLVSVTRQQGEWGGRGVRGVRGEIKGTGRSGVRGRKNLYSAKTQWSDQYGASHKNWEPGGGAPTLRSQGTPHEERQKKRQDNRGVGKAVEGLKVKRAPEVPLLPPSGTPDPNGLKTWSFVW